MYNRVRSMIGLSKRRAGSVRASARASRRPALDLLEERTLLTGTWTPLVNALPNGDSATTMLLLSNGDVIANGSMGGGGNLGEASGNWYMLAPDSKGNYVDGTWTTLAEAPEMKLYYASDLLPDGRVFVMGGEYSGPDTTNNDSNAGEIYNPVSNTWTVIAPFPEATAGDDVSEVLNDGNVLVGSNSDSNTFIYNPTSNSWSQGPRDINGDNFGEEGWTKLWDGSTLDYQIEGSISQGTVRLVSGATDSTGQWVNSGTVPVRLDDDGGNTDLVPELGPGFMLPDGKAFWVGASSNTALYTLPTSSNPTGTWTAGPTQSDSGGGSVGAYDAPGAVEPNGDVLWSAGPNDGSYSGPTTMLEYDPKTNAITNVGANGPDLSGAEFTTRLLDLPSGQILFTNSFSGHLYVYNPVGAADPSWAPTVSSVTLTGNTYTLTGTQLNGLDEGTNYGDDVQNATNYPIIKLTDASGNVTFAKSFDWSSNWVGTGNTPETTEFTLPAGASQGNYTLNVIANGISSTNFTFNTHPLTVTAVAPTNAVEGIGFSSEVATFTDSSFQPLSNYTATIDWGDKTAPSVGEVQLISTSGLNGQPTYEVLGQHTYAQGGTYQMSVTVDTSDGGSSSSTTSVTVAGLPLIAAGTSASLTEGDELTTPLATFSDTSTVTHPISEYTATITFGDDRTSVAGLIVADAGGGFDVEDTSGHTYNGGSYEDAITISKPGYTTTVFTQLNVRDSPLTSQGFTLVPNYSGQPFTGAAPIEGQTYTGVLAEFNDADPRHPPASNYYATIDYGDGSAPVYGKVVADPNDDGYSWAVEGSFAFSAQPYAITVTIGNFSGGNTSVAYTTADVTAAPITAQSYSFTPTAGQTFTGYVAGFSSADPRNPPISNFSATVTWGDGTSSAGNILVNTDGGYLVQASHAYTTGSYVITTSIVSSLGAGATVTGTAVVSDAGMQLTLPATIGPAEVGVPFNGEVGLFTTPNNLAHPADYSATITWGDGTTSPGVITASGTYPYVSNGVAQAGQTFLISSPGKVFTALGSFPVTVALTSPGGTQQQLSSTIAVQGAPVTVTPLTVAGVSKTPLNDVIVGGFSSQDSVATASDFAATILWGDGTTSSGTIVPTPSGIFLVEGNHTYAEGGSYTIGLIINGGNAPASVTTTATISNQLVAITGTLVNSSGNNLINSSTPTFRGTAAPNAKVTLSAVNSGGVSTVIGTGTADATGAYAITSSTLADGQYTIVASATDATGQASSPATALYPSVSQGPLTIDTQGPKVASVTFSPASGTFSIVFSDGLTGLARASLENGSNYSLTSSTGQSYSVSGITVSPLAPQTQETLTLSFNTGGKLLKKGTYILQINSAGVTDNAGNSLDERYYVPFPGLYNSAGQSYVAAFNVNGAASSPPQQYVPAVQVKAAAKHRLFVRSHTFRR